ncbi:MAG TPA: hypothetical protein VFU60_17015 [Ktedonobacterales bacterium]|nr:hypothetical protein [Ktedonobacterales bacterium]
MIALENTSYDLLTTLQNKLEGINAYDQYIQDAQQAGDQDCANLFQQLKQQDSQQAQQIRSTIEQMVKQGKFH